MVTLLSPRKREGMAQFTVMVLLNVIGFSMSSLSVVHSVVAASPVKQSVMSTLTVEPA